MLLFLFFCLPTYIHSSTTSTNRHRKRCFINVHYPINTNIHAGFFEHNEARTCDNFDARLCPQRITYITLHRWNESYKFTKSRLFTRTVIFNGTVSLLKKDESINSCSTNVREFIIRNEKRDDKVTKVRLRMFKLDDTSLIETQSD